MMAAPYTISSASPRRPRCDSRISKRSMPLLSILLLVFAVTAFGAEPEPNAALVSQLKSNTQQMYDAVVSGNKEPWQKYFADDCIFADEKGRLFNKSQLVADITPLPTGYGGVIKIADLQSRVVGD